MRATMNPTIAKILLSLSLGAAAMVAFPMSAMVTSPAYAQGTEGTPPSESEENEEEPSFEDASSAMHAKLEASLQELTALQEEIKKEKLPLAGKLGELEKELSAVRQEFQDTTRILDSRTLDLSNLRTEIESRQNEVSYLATLLGEYVRNFETRLHVAEVHRYEKVLETAKLAAENTSLSDQEVFSKQSVLLETSLARLEDALGGTRFEGKAVGSGGLLADGTFLLFGPAAYFLSSDGLAMGTAEQRVNSYEATIVPFAEETDGQQLASLIEAGSGSLPLDPTLGNAHKIAATKETFFEHVQKGGPVMIPIFVMAGLALLVAIWKWISLSLLPKPSRKRVDALLHSVAEHDEEAAQGAAARIRGPIGEMLRSGVEHLREPRELVEEVMYETMLTTKLRTQRLLPFIAICAASAPLLGLLGTVTGIINTFKMITVFGSGDVKSLSGGISEALITTKFGLIVAIPSLLLHAFLSRKARGFVDRMERAAISFVNQVSKTPFAPANGQNGSMAGGAEAVPVADPVQAPARAAAAPVGAAVSYSGVAGGSDPAVKAQVREALGEILGGREEERRGSGRGPERPGGGGFIDSGSASI